MSTNSSRQNAYKNKGNTSENLRKKRQESNVQLRKGKRNEQMLKRRNINLEDLNTSPLKERNRQDSCGVIMNFEEIISGIMNDNDPEKQFLCTQNARKVLSRERHPPINKMVEANIVVKLVEFLHWEHNPLMQFEAAWGLTNIASGNSAQTAAVVDCKAVPCLIKLLSNSNMSVVEQAMWALGNIAGDGAVLRDHVLQKGIIVPLIALARPTAQITFLQNLTWTLSNLCRNKNPHTAINYVVQLLPTLVNLVLIDDIQVKTDVCWALSYITDGPNDRIELVLSTGVLEELVRLLQNSNDGMLLTPVLRVIGNIVTGTDLQTQKVIESGCLSAFNKLLTHERTNIQKEATWTLSNITAGTQSQIQAVIDAGLVPDIVRQLTAGDFRTQKEACWAVTNYTSGASVDQLVYLGKHHVIEGLCALLEIKEAKMLQVCLDGLSNMLITAEKVNALDDMCCAIEACGGVDAIEKLQQHENETVYSMAIQLIDRFFSEEEAEDQAIVPANDENGSYFQFTDSQTSLPSGGFRL